LCPEDECSGERFDEEDSETYQEISHSKFGDAPISIAYGKGDL
jgi:hypothetical protein